MRKLIYPPDSNGYGWTPGPETVSVELKGGAPRVRVDILNSASTLQATWTLDVDKYDYFMSFYNVVIAKDAGKFKCDLVSDSPGLKEHECIFMPNSVSLVEQSGLTYKVQAKLTVMPVIKNIDDMASIIDFIEAYGGICNARKAINLFDKLANVYLPRIKNE